MEQLKKVVLIGPESTGKSTLAAQLAAHYHTLWCPEYARQYLQEKGARYQYDDLLEIAKGQLALEDAYAEKAMQHWQANEQRTMVPLLFVDTNMHVMKVWSEFVFNQCHPYIDMEIISRRYDLFLLTNTDLPWVYDELREQPDARVRQTIFELYHSMLAQQEAAWVAIAGDAHQRLQAAIDAVDNLLLLSGDSGA